ncbi:HAD-IG family 5'-nucleotidase [Myxococcota bacterium]|nr:HAD-IG family 5'-nucleotidase [Myxococcota bacterium]MBU1432537.1 HAD-IG family 5'-nucleotidase [Myxococcota bacterium]MBU1898680.1 HAD-IG family 5'-nucleotidase [Myxococcota bacterium]
MNPRDIFCNRTLNLKSIQAIGYDMDYTLIHYNVEVWEGAAYHRVRDALAARGWPVADLRFEPERVIRGLIIDRELGNLVKANRFGYVKRAYHGTRAIDHEATRRLYGRVRIDLRQRRWVFLNTLFSISSGCMYAQLVERHDQGLLKMGYAALWDALSAALDETHQAGLLKAEIIADPQRFITPDPEVARALLDQREAGKKLLLITNSGWDYAAPMMRFAFDPYLPGTMTWRDLFDYSFLDSLKPNFFSTRMPTFEVVDDSGLMRSYSGPLKQGGVYIGGNAALVEDSLGVDAGDILYVGDHIFTDVNIATKVLRWRTALILRELEDEVAALEAFEPQQAQLRVMMEEKAALEAQLHQRLLRRQRIKEGHEQGDLKALKVEIDEGYGRLNTLNDQIGPLAEAASQLSNPHWGLLMRTGNDKSHLARQVERYADVYTSRVSNFLAVTPFGYLRSPRGSLPHDL